MESVSSTDRELVAQAQGGDDDAFAVLVRRHQGRAVNVAYQLLRNEEDAVEVAQDAFVRMYRSLGGFRGECEFTTWLHQIVVNLARNKRRWWWRHGRERTESLDVPVESGDGEVNRQMAAASDPADVELGKLEFVQLLERRMAELPQNLREVLMLRNVEALRYEEIAAVLQCSVGTVKSRIARARDALRAAMKDEWP
ncbi:MAG: sigma-70 family RNA polymerase sigma factor [Verrucomicrobia bacterium]|nr:sigma-70 family RNA polymerase sigma factor [Verrucomicrobiota bacterium]